MSNTMIPWLCLLPVEILHHIFDCLDASTILFSLRCTCRRLKTIVDSYDRYVLDFRSISKSDFQLLCCLINPRKVKSLTLFPKDETSDQLELFMTYFRIQEFTRLRSLTLIEIEERQLKVLLKRFCIPSLTSFSFKLGKYDDRRINTTATLLSSIISQANLHHLNLELRSTRIEKMIWPAQCLIKYLKIGSCDEFSQIFTILRCSPHLQTFVIKFSSYVDDTIISLDSFRTSFQQLTSLTLENLRANVNNLELLLSLMTSLTYLKLIGLGHFLNGNRWEQFIQTNLPCLKKFELFVQEWKDVDYTSVDIEAIIELFRTSFWIEHKKWFFTCETIELWPRVIKLYSIPLCISTLTYEPESNKISSSTFYSIINNDMSIMDNIDTIDFKFSKFTLDDIQQQAHPNIITDLSSLLQQACSLTSLDICCNYDSRRSKLTAQDIYSMTPSHVKHLAASIKNLNEVKICLTKLQHLLTARFFYRSSSFSNVVVEWLEQEKAGSSYFVGAVFTKVWFVQSNNQYKLVRIGNKRIKLTVDH
ncbi:unnamed protein product [Rotaria sordida]|uniref:F-box domain-containing protein n=1 Tax=Rotaria sordida TaxID=392033 RepID=A0A818LQQ7_9BILA|nr:unnamed protein product [Rotaria sordida]CAF3581751.1 unnamed protein product [Rotaria sordida]